MVGGYPAIFFMAALCVWGVTKVVSIMLGKKEVEMIEWETRVVR